MFIIPSVTGESSLTSCACACEAAADAFIPRQKATGDSLRFPMRVNRSITRRRKVMIFRDVNLKAKIDFLYAARMITFQKRLKLDGSRQGF